MKTRFLFFLLAAATVGFTSCKRINGKGEVETRHFDLTGFDVVDLSNRGDVQLVADANQFVEVETNSNLFEALDIKVNNGTLKIGTKTGYSIGKYDKLVYYVHAPVLKEVNVSGSGDVSGGSGIAASDFKVSISGSGNISVADVVCQSLEGKISGSGNITFTGTAAHTNFDISGSGDVSAFDLESHVTDVKISGSGDVETRTVDQLNINVSGSGDVKYKGHPSVNVNSSGSGDVIDAN